MLHASTRLATQHATQTLCARSPRSKPSLKPPHPHRIHTCKRVMQAQRWLSQRAPETAVATVRSRAGQPVVWAHGTSHCLESVLPCEPSVCSSFVIYEARRGRCICSLEHRSSLQRSCPVPGSSSVPIGDFPAEGVLRPPGKASPWRRTARTACRRCCRVCAICARARTASSLWRRSDAPPQPPAALYRRVLSEAGTIYHLAWSQPASGVASFLPRLLILVAVGHLDMVTRPCSETHDCTDSPPRWCPPSRTSHAAARRNRWDRRNRRRRHRRRRGAAAR